MPPRTSLAIVFGLATVLCFAAVASAFNCPAGTFRRGSMCVKRSPKEDRPEERRRLKQKHVSPSQIIRPSRICRDRQRICNAKCRERYARDRNRDAQRACRRVCREKKRACDRLR